MKNRDPFVILQLANPVPGEELDQVLTTPALHELYEGIVKATPPTRHARPRRRRLALVAAALVLALATVGWVVVQAVRQPAEPSSVACYAAADLASRTEVVRNDGRAPVDICADLWRRGVFGAVAVPPLVACVIPSGHVGVLPATGGDTCRDVGAATLGTSPSTTAGPTPSATLDPATLAAGLADAFLASSCVDEAQARAIAQRELAARGLTDWAVAVQGRFTPERPCATVGVDTPEKTVRLIPAPPSRR